jgi:hypothetical protein
MVVVARSKAAIDRWNGNVTVETSACPAWWVTSCACVSMRVGSVPVLSEAMPPESVALLR